MKPLDGVKVLDMSWVVAGPLVGRALADAGATVVRVESGTKVETARLMPPFENGIAGHENSALYGNVNAGKLGVSLDLRVPEAREVARSLANWADVVLESYAPGRMKKWGLEYETLRETNPGLIMVSSSINGQDGPYSGLAGYGNVGAALSGFQSVVGWADRLPVGPFGPYTDYLAPRFGLAALLAALLRRQQTGVGTYIDISQVEAGAYLQSPYLAKYFAEGDVVERRGNSDPALSPNGVYPCADNRFIAITAGDDDQWRMLATIMNVPDAIDEFGAAGDRIDRADEVDDLVADWTARHRAQDLEDLLQRVGIAAYVSADSRAFCEDPQLRHRGHLVELNHPLHGRVTVEGPRYQLGDTPLSVDRAAPVCGQDNDYVLRDILGFSAERIDALKNEGALA
ncbi:MULTISPECIES: CoA transferase [unclassified Rhodococcus (in: high G+C Gram-positive bacteria)]|uniref:CaiB/BaiF CoA transferase family protein n=1 Tax=unclassified Rhodococcus (in: high G+C Gram-positive bacteria) TaxID=192944 RepID=UPI0027E17A2D|nr:MULTISPECIES: CoA transferase [unclassified Rhodococcus (in: high G+C Gram-positive bacteria)]